ncbi:chitin deacetylase [Chytriomyces hyalinus]|nr:chitin deacetylase [Chytriomyces hyalinus]
MPNFDFSWADNLSSSLTVPVTGVPIWNRYFQVTNPSPEYEDSDVTRCVGPTPDTWGVTYDDGPSPFTPTLLAALEKKQWKSTFFTIGKNIIKYPEILLETYTAGHQIALHTWSHNYLTQLTDDEIVADLVYNAKAMYQTLGVVPSWFRPPSGDIDSRVRKVAARMGLRSVKWSYDSRDWALADNITAINEKVPAAVKKWLDSNTPYGISLEHDLKQSEVDVAVVVLDVVQQAGRKVVPIYECMGQASGYDNKVLKQFFDAGQFESPNKLVIPGYEEESLVPSPVVTASVSPDTFVTSDAPSVSPDTSVTSGTALQSQTPGPVKDTLQNSAKTVATATVAKSSSHSSGVENKLFVSFFLALLLL